MNGIIYLLGLIGIAWLVAWFISDPANPRKIWWPFDLQGEPEKPKPRAWRARLRVDATVDAPAARGAATPAPRRRR